MRLSVAVLAVAAIPLSAASAHSHSAPRRAELAKYSHLYYAVRHQLGHRAPGRNIRRRGVTTSRGTRRASAHEVAVSIRQLRLLRLGVLSPRPPSQSPAGVLTARAASGIAACIRSHESGGNYRAVSPNGLYRGAFQFDYGTFAKAGGHGDPAAASPAEQDAAFARWWPGHHGAWPVSGPACGG